MLRALLIRDPLNKKSFLKMHWDDHAARCPAYLLYLLSSTSGILSDEPDKLDGIEYRRQRVAAELSREEPARLCGSFVPQEESR